MRWYVAQTQPGLETTAERNLLREGFRPHEVYLSRRYDGQRIFPNYLFVQLTSPNFAAVVNRTRGILKLLPRHTNSPLPLPLGFVTDLRKRLMMGDLSSDAEEALLQRWVPGQIVKMTDGPFRDHRGRFLRYTKDCAIVLSYLLGREFEVTVPLDQLCAAAA